MIDESNSNFGFNLPWWDHLFGTYRAQPQAGHLGMKIGVEPLQRSDPAGLMGLLGMPFVSEPGGYPIGQRWDQSDQQTMAPDKRERESPAKEQA